MQLNKLLQKKRHEKNLSQSDIGKEIGASIQLISNFERGGIKKMSPKLVFLYGKKMSITEKALRELVGSELSEAWIQKATGKKRNLEEKK
jgi:transcriptional regulator with XRE-family HTH domain